MKQKEQMTTVTFPYITAHCYNKSCPYRILQIFSTPKALCQNSVYIAARAPKLVGMHLMEIYRFLIAIGHFGAQFGLITKVSRSQTAILPPLFHYDVIGRRK